MKECELPVHAVVVGGIITINIRLLYKIEQYLLASREHSIRCTRNLAMYGDGPDDTQRSAHFYCNAACEAWIAQPPIAPG
jgi:hypothetical protein